MKEAQVGIGTCGCKHCRSGQNKYSKKLRNKSRRRHIYAESKYLKIIGELDNSKFKMRNFSQYTD